MRVDSFFCALVRDLCCRWQVFSALRRLFGGPPNCGALRFGIARPLNRKSCVLLRQTFLVSFSLLVSSSSASSSSICSLEMLRGVPKTRRWRVCYGIVIFVFPNFTCQSASCFFCTLMLWFLSTSFFDFANLAISRLIDPALGEGKSRRERACLSVRNPRIVETIS